MANCSRPRPSRNRPLAAESLEIRTSLASIPVHGVIVPLPEIASQVVAMNDLGDDPPHHSGPAARHGTGGARIIQLSVK